MGHSSSLYRISRMGGGPGSNGGGELFYIGEVKISRFFKLENFQKMLKNLWKIYNFLKIFWNFIEIFAKISGKL